MRNLKLILIIYFVAASQSFSQQHQRFTDVLQDHVKDGLVDYENLRNDVRLDEYLNQLSSTDPEQLTKNEKLAFWINAYNAFTLQIVNKNYPVESITELHTGGKIIGYLLGKTVWDKEFIIINKKEYSLNEIEHEILRKMDEPRIHFAIVCASISCPELLSAAFEPDKIEPQLNDATIKFLNDKERNDFDLAEREAYISKIFDWFEEDFGNNDEEVLTFIVKFLLQNIAGDIKSNLSGWDISYKSYDWGLNDIKTH